MNFVRLCAALTLCLGAGGAAQAQLTSANIPVELQETGFFGMGARAAGMGWAYTAVAEDVTAVAYNPAGLAQIRQVELSVGLAYDSVNHMLTRSGSGTTDDTATRLEHFAFAYPVPTYRGSLVWSFAYHRMADLDENTFMNGYRTSPGQGSQGMVEVEDVLQSGTVNAWTGGLGWDLSHDISIGVSLSYLSGGRDEDVITALGSPDPAAGCQGTQADQYGLYYGCGEPPDSVLFKDTVHREADLDGWTGSFSVMGFLGSGFRVAGVVNLPRWLQYQGGQTTRHEDYWAVEAYDEGFADDITLPMSLGGGASWAQSGFLASADFLWTDWKQIDFEGDILAPNRQPAYRATVTLGVGAEYQFSGTPFRVRGGFRLDPLPYKLITADAELQYDNGPDGIPGPVGEEGNSDDSSVTLRNYPEAEITTNRKWFTVGAGVLIPAGLTLDAAYQHGSWSRESGTAYVPPFGFVTSEDASHDRFFLTAVVHFQ